ncbi:unnamed protein product [Ectocarpus sp. CCAP 1310/34]|nr:unnamed protein product [Ectocarpus sp. CCAP 1310/34]
MDALNEDRHMLNLTGDLYWRLPDT